MAVDAIEPGLGAIYMRVPRQRARQLWINGCLYPGVSVATEGDDEQNAIRWEF